MRNTVISIILFLFGCQLVAQEGIHLVKDISMDLPGKDEYFDVARYPNGNVVLAGYTESKQFKQEDILVTLLDTAQKIIWKKNIGYGWDDRGHSVRITREGNILVGGYVSLTYPGNELPSPQALLVLLNRDGVIIDRQIYFAEESSRINAVVQLSNGDIVAAGRANEQGLIFKTNIKSTSWEKTLSYEHSEIYDVLRAQDDQIIIVGSRADRVSHKGFFHAYNTDGDPLWVKRNVPSLEKPLSVLQLSPDKGLIGGYGYAHRTRQDGILLEFSLNDGRIFNQKLYGGRYEDGFEDVLQLPGGELLAAGYTYSHLPRGARRSQAWVIHLDNNLNQIGKEKLLGGNQNDKLFALNLTGENNIVGIGSLSDGLGRLDGWVVDWDYNRMDLVESTLGEEKPLEKETIIPNVLVQVLSRSSKDTLYAEQTELIEFALLNNGDKAVYVDILELVLDSTLRFATGIGNLSPNQEVNFTIPVRIPKKASDKIYNATFSTPSKVNLKNGEYQIYVSRPYIHEIYMDLEPVVLSDNLIDEDGILQMTAHITNTGIAPSPEFLLDVLLPDYLERLDTKQKISLNPGESLTHELLFQVKSIAPEDSTNIHVWLEDTSDSIMEIKYQSFSVSELMKPLIAARQSRLDNAILQALKAGENKDLNTVQLSKSPLDSFFRKNTVPQVVISPLQQERIVEELEGQLFWINPDPIRENLITKTALYEYEILSRLITNIEKDFSAKAIVHGTTSDTFNLNISGGPYFNGYQYNVSGKIALTEGENKVEISVSVGEEQKINSSPAIIGYEPPRSNLHIYAIGVPHDDLPWVTKDAADFVTLFEGQEGGLYEKVTSHLLNEKFKTSAQSLRKSIRDIQLDYFEFNRIEPNDVIVIYLSTHGFMLGNEYRIAASDFDFLYEVETSLELKDDILTRLDLIPCKKVVFVDACYSGAIANLDMMAGIKGDLKPRSIDLSKALHQLAQSENDFYFMLSSGPGELSYADDSWNNSAFTKAIQEAVHSVESDTNSDDILTLGEWYAFVKKLVPKLVAGKKDIITGQTPTLSNEQGLELPILVLDNK